MLLRLETAHSLGEVGVMGKMGNWSNRSSRQRRRGDNMVVCLATVQLQSRVLL